MNNEYTSIFETPELNIPPGTFQTHKMDSIEWLKSLADSSVDLIVTDPAYESLEKHRAVGSQKRLRNWFEIFPNTRFLEFFTECYRVLKNNTHMYMFCDQETMFFTKPIGEQVGFKFWKPIIWDKCDMGLGFHYRARYEVILFFEKGKRNLLNQNISDVLRVQKVHQGYPTEKPVEVSEILIANSSLSGELVIDPFMGSGSIGEAALKLDRCFAGSDISDVSIQLVKDRLTKVLFCKEKF